MLEPGRDVQMLDVRELRPHEDNPRSITAERFGALKDALAAAPQMLRARPCIALPDGRVIAGNMRYRAALELVELDDPAFLEEFPDGRVPAYVVDLAEAEAREWALRDNNAYGDWEDEALHEYVTTLEQMGGRLDLTGFPKGDVQMILEGVSPAPSRFVQFDASIPTDYQCPHCGYEWSGSKRPRETDSARREKGGRGGAPAAA